MESSFFHDADFYFPPPPRQKKSQGGRLFVLSVEKLFTWILYVFIVPFHLKFDKYKAS